MQRVEALKLRHLYDKTIKGKNRVDWNNVGIYKLLPEGQGVGHKYTHISFRNDASATAVLPSIISVTTDWRLDGNYLAYSAKFVSPAGCAEKYTQSMHTMFSPELLEQKKPLVQDWRRSTDKPAEGEADATPAKGSNGGGNDFQTPTKPTTKHTTDL